MVINLIYVPFIVLKLMIISTNCLCKWLPMSEAQILWHYSSKSAQ